jgi:hypothetical protein
VPESGPRHYGKGHSSLGDPTIRERSVPLRDGQPPCPRGSPHIVAEALEALRALFYSLIESAKLAGVRYALGLTNRARSARASR